MNRFQMTFDEYQEQAAKTDLNGFFPMETIVLGLVSEVGELAEMFYKAKRDERKLDTTEMLKELGDILWYIGSICSNNGVRLQSIAEMNLQKLADRQARGKIQGSGDNR